MATDSGPLLPIEIINDTGINVVGLLKSEIGDKRHYALRIDTLPLADDLTARNVDVGVRLTHLRDRILAAANFTADVDLECVRCLRVYPQPVKGSFSEEYWQTVDVRTGVGVTPEDAPEEDDERFSIDENHELDLGEALRQHIVLALPMRADCGDTCPGPDLPGSEGDEAIDDRFAALSRLLGDAPATQ